MPPDVSAGLPVTMGATQVTLLIATTISGIVATIVGALVTLTTQRREHRAAQQARAATDAQHLEAAIRRYESLQHQIALNTTLTRETSMRADDAYNAANNVNEKMAHLGVFVETESAKLDTAQAIAQQLAQLQRQVAALVAAQTSPPRVGGEERRTGEDRRRV